MAFVIIKKSMVPAAWGSPSCENSIHSVAAANSATGSCEVTPNARSMVASGYLIVAWSSQMRFFCEFCEFFIRHLFCFLRATGSCFSDTAIAAPLTESSQPQLLLESDVVVSLQLMGGLWPIVFFACRDSVGALRRNRNYLWSIRVAFDFSSLPKRLRPTDLG